MTECGLFATPGDLPSGLGAVDCPTIVQSLTYRRPAATTRTSVLSHIALATYIQSFTDRSRLNNVTDDKEWMLVVVAIYTASLLLHELCHGFRRIVSTVERPVLGGETVQSMKFTIRIINHNVPIELRLSRSFARLIL